jgi:hypothetical protein
VRDVKRLSNWLVRRRIDWEASPPVGQQRHVRGHVSAWHSPGLVAPHEHAASERTSAGTVTSDPGSVCLWVPPVQALGGLDRTE